MSQCNCLDFVRFSMLFRFANLSMDAKFWYEPWNASQNCRIAVSGGAGETLIASPRIGFLPNATSFIVLFCCFELSSCLLICLKNSAEQNSFFQGHHRLYVCPCSSSTLWRFPEAVTDWSGVCFQYRSGVGNRENKIGSGFDGWPNAIALLAGIVLQ